MGNKVLNNQVFEVFVIIAETLEKWQGPTTEAGQAVLAEHYKWGAELKDKNYIILAGPANLDLISTNQINPTGFISGFIMIQVSTREEALRWAEKDPFHLHGYRRNTVHSLRITMTGNHLFETIQKTINPQ